MGRKAPRHATEPYGAPWEANWRTLSPKIHIFCPFLLFGSSHLSSLFLQPISIVSVVRNAGHWLRGKKRSEEDGKWEDKHKGTTRTTAERQMGEVRPQIHFPSFRHFALLLSFPPPTSTKCSGGFETFRTGWMGGKGREENGKWADKHNETARITTEHPVVLFCLFSVHLFPFTPQANTGRFETAETPGIGWREGENEETQRDTRAKKWIRGSHVRRLVFFGVPLGAFLTIFGLVLSLFSPPNRYGTFRNRRNAWYWL